VLLMMKGVGIERTKLTKCEVKPFNYLRCIKQENKYEPR
jgi:hypothetical protein